MGGFRVQGSGVIVEGFGLGGGDYNIKSKEQLNSQEVSERHDECAGMSSHYAMPPTPHGLPCRTSAHINSTRARPHEDRLAGPPSSAM